MLPRYLISILIILISLWGCVKKENPAPKDPDEITIDTLLTFANFDEQNIASPTGLKLLGNGLIAVADYSTQVITLLNKEGEVTSTFGRQGRGPGEFLNIRHMYDIGYGVAVFDSHQNMLSYFDYDGELLASHSLPSHALNKDFTLINDSLYAINMEGLNGHLFQLRNLNSDSVFEFGTPNVTWEERGSLSDGYNQLTSGEVPNMLKNKAKLYSDKTHLYVFFEALSEIQKYDLEGNLIWHHKINLPHNQEIFEGTVESAKKYGSSNSFPGLDYATEFQKSEEGIFILTSRAKPKNVKQYLVRVNEAGDIQTIYHFPKTHEICFDFDIQALTNTLYLTSCLSGNVKKAQLGKAEITD